MAKKPIKKPTQTTANDHAVQQPVQQPVRQPVRQRTHLSTNQLTAIRTTLIERLHSLDKQMCNGNKLDETITGGDACDLAFGTVESNLASKLSELGSKEANQIEYALHQLTQGCYGICEYCQDNIPGGRLTHLPYCTLCVKCQVLMEAGDIDEEAVRRRQQTYDLSPPPSTDDVEITPSKRLIVDKDQ